VMRYLHGIGIQGVTVETTEMAMSRGPMVQYRNWAEPDAMIGLLRAFHMGRGLSPASRKLLEEMMIHTETAPNRLKGLLPAGTIVAHKTGTSGTDGDLARATNDVGIVTLPDGRHVAIAVFVSDSRADLAAREGAIAKMAKAAWEHWH
jgi:beta-lactamase class A